VVLAVLSVLTAGAEGPFAYARLLASPWYRQTLTGPQLAHMDSLKALFDLLLGPWSVASGVVVIILDASVLRQSIYSGRLTLAERLG